MHPNLVSCALVHRPGTPPFVTRSNRQDALSDGTSPGSDDQPRLLGERYEVIETVGEGASAITWRGIDRRLGRPVAIKILKRDSGQDPAWAQRFEREASTSAGISHANVVHVYDAGQQDGWLYLVMQLIDGEDLKALIRRRGHLPANEAIGYARQILQGLSAIHRNGILHRDIKPQNVLVDRDGIARVTDFGIAHTALDSNLTTAGMAIGTAAYMAPEQAQAGTLSEATDIYAVGVVLYEMLTGQVPYDRPTPIATMLAHIQETPVAPSSRAPDAGIPPRLDGIVLQAMSRDPSDRFRSAQAMLRALDDPVRSGGETTRVAIGQDRTTVAPKVTPRDQAWPAPAAPATPAPPPVRQETAGGGGRGLLTFLLALILLSMAAVAAYMVYDATRDDDPGDGAVTATADPTREPTPTDEAIIGPPTDAPPTAEPTAEPTREPTAEPTDVPIEVATQSTYDTTEQVIEPVSTNPP